MQGNACAPSFGALDLGTTKATSIPMETVEIEIGAGDIISNYGTAFIKEAYRKNPLRAEQVGLTEAEMSDYIEYLFTKRIECVNGNCSDFRKLKNLYIPSFVQYAISQIGVVILRTQGLCLRPIARHASTMTFEEALTISEKIGMFEDDLQIVHDAMPRDPEGNKDVMSTALIAGYVRSLREVEHVSSTYIAAFMDMKLKEEAAFQALYRVQYDDVAFITSALTAGRGLF